MATVKREETSAGPRWRVRYRRPDGTETSKRFNRSGVARDFATKIENDKRTGAYVDQAGPRMTFREMAEVWAPLADHADTSRQTRDRDLRLHVFPVIGAMRLGQVTELELGALQRQLQAKLGPASVQRVWYWVSSVFNAAVRAKKLAVSPAAGMWPKRAQAAELVPLEGGMVEALLAELPAHYRTGAILAARAGLRLGEVFGLTTGRVTWLSREPLIRVERQLITISGRPAYLRLPKGRKVRTVPVGPSVIEPLAAHLAGSARSRAFDEVAEREETGLVFATVNGTPVRRAPIDRSFARAVKRAELPEGTRFHDLRHYYASTLIDAGLSEREIGIRLGHSTATVTAHYGHLLHQADDRTRAAVEAAAAAAQAVAR